MYENNPATNTETVGRYTARTFGWMFLGLAVTFAVMVAAYMTGLSLALLSVPAILVLTLVELAVVFKLSASVGKISVGMSRGLFFLYAVINGLVFWCDGCGGLLYFGGSVAHQDAVVRRLDPADRL